MVLLKLLLLHITSYYYCALQAAITAHYKLLSLRITNYYYCALQATITAHYKLLLLRITVHCAALDRIEHFVNYCGFLRKNRLLESLLDICLLPSYSKLVCHTSYFHLGGSILCSDR